MTPDDFVSVVAAAARGEVDALLWRLVTVLHFKAPEGVDFQYHSSDLELPGQLPPPIEGLVFESRALRAPGHAVLRFDEDGGPAFAWFWPLEATPEATEFEDDRFRLARVGGWVLFELRDVALRDEVLDRVGGAYRYDQPRLRFDSWLLTVRAAAQERALTRPRPELLRTIPPAWREMEPTEAQERVLARVAALRDDLLPGSDEVRRLSGALRSAGDPLIKRRATPSSLTAAARFGAAAELWVDYHRRLLSMRHLETRLRLPGTGRSFRLDERTSHELLATFNRRGLPMDGLLLRPPN
jgi:hypothetical protein